MRVARRHAHDDALIGRYRPPALAPPPAAFIYCSLRCEPLGDLGLPAAAIDGAGLYGVCVAWRTLFLVGDRLKEYELLFIVSPRVPADDVTAAIDRVTGLIEGSGGEIISVDNWGRRRLAYPIRHFFEGTYVLVALRMPPTGAAPLEASLVISEEVIRHLLTEGIIPQVNRDRGHAFEDRERAPAAPEPMAAAPVGAAAPSAVAVADAPAAVASTEAAPAVEAPSAAEVTPTTDATEATEAATATETAATEPAPAATE